MTSEVIIIIIIDHFCIVLFFALVQTHCVFCLFDCFSFNIHQSSVLTALFGCCMAGASETADVSAQVLCTSLKCHIIQIDHIR